MNTVPAPSVPAGATRAQSERRPSLGGATVALLESRRRSELGDLIVSYGGVPCHAPALREEPVADLTRIAAFLDASERDGLDAVLFQTGVGTRALHDGIDQLGRFETWRALLARAIVAVRGPKPTAALRAAGIRVDVAAAEPYTTADLLAALAPHDLSDRRVAIQHYGERNATLSDALRARGATLHDLDVYRWTLPDDLTPLETLLRDLPLGRIGALVVTSQVQIQHLFEVAEQRGLAASLSAALATQTVVVAVGPVAARALVARGIRVDVEPAHPKMGAMVHALASFLQQRMEQ